MKLYVKKRKHWKQWHTGKAVSTRGKSGLRDKRVTLKQRREPKREKNSKTGGQRRKEPEDREEGPLKRK
jgi:hypothetical protein